ncbi:MAG: M4 family metallopeptidase [Bacteroidota bacterium]
MKQFICSLFLVCTTVLTVSAQFKPNLESSDPQLISDVRPIETSFNPVSVPSARLPFQYDYSQVMQRSFSWQKEGLQSLTITRDPKTLLPISLEGDVPELATNLDRSRKAIQQQTMDYLTAVQSILNIYNAKDEFVVTNIKTDQLEQTHIKVQQQFQGIPIHGGELLLHTQKGQIQLLNGRIFPTPDLSQTTPTIKQEKAIQIALDDVEKDTKFHELTGTAADILSKEQLKAELVIHHPQLNPDAERLVWKVEVIPHLAMDRFYFIDALTGEILHFYNKVCRLHAHHKSAPVVVDLPKFPRPISALTGPTTAQARDLNGRTVTINTYELTDQFVMLDAARAMYRSGAATLDDVRGGIVTLDANSTSPLQDEEFTANYITSFSNTWNDPTSVSAHNNAGVAYEYFRQTFNRNSIDGSGGNIYSFINITDEDGEDFDNAFWAGIGMFYGNGDVAFTPLAGGLDAAAHEMSHGVIQATADLEYLSQSGALNESFADVFGVLIDRDDWRIGEDIVNTNVFRSGAMRDLQNPSNGGRRFGDTGWQPRHIDEYVELPETEQGDNGGVHINSGIPNHAFYLIASNIGRQRAEQIYYRALDNYLVRSSQFVDARVAIVQSAIDLYGNNSGEEQRVRAAFDAVGIVGETSNDYQVDLEENPGQEFVLFSNSNQTSIGRANGSGDVLADPFIPEGLTNRISMTDDGTFGVFVSDQNQLIFVDFNANQYGFIENNPQSIWRNVVISKDGSRLAILTNTLEPSIVIFDFISQQQRTFELYNPTTAEGQTANSVQYADAMEFTYDGEFLMYDAYNELSTFFGDPIDYWDINFIKVWDNRRDNFGDGLVLNLFKNLPDNTSIGNPTFSKNSPHIIAFDLLDNNDNSFSILGANIETGDNQTIFRNATIGYPNFAPSDQFLYFDALDQQNNPVLAKIPLSSSKITAGGDGFVFLRDAKWGVAYATGERVLSDIEEIETDTWTIAPNPFSDQLQLITSEITTTDQWYQLTDVTGKILLKGLLPKGEQQHTLSVKHLPEGIYFLQWQTARGMQTQQVVKVRF